MPTWIAPTAIGLAGNVWGQYEQERQRKKLLAQIMAMMEPGRLGGEADEIFQMLKRSPLFTGMRTNALESANMLGNRMQTNFARSGLNTSGIAAMALPAARSSFQQNFNEIDMGLFSKALSAAMGNRDKRISALGDFGMGKDPLAVGTGMTLDALAPYLRSLMTRGGGRVLGGPAPGLSPASDPWDTP